MTKSIFVSVAVLALSASGAFAAHHHHHHRHAMNPVGAEGAPPAAPPAGNVSSSGQTQYMKNLHDSGYNPKDDYSAAGIMRDH